MFPSRVLTAFCLFVAALATPARAAITYTGTFDLAGGTGAIPTATVALSFTTDGMIGGLTFDNLLDYSVTITQGAASATLTPANSTADLSGPDWLTATATALTFHFESIYQGGFLIFDEHRRGPFICFQINYCDNTAGPQLQAGIDVDDPVDGGDPFLTGVGPLVIGVASPVPEPAAWSLLIVGFGLAGTALRRARRQGEVPLVAH